MKCPHYESVRGYCKAYRPQGMMIPSVMEEKKYCLKSDGYLQCPIYRARQAIGRGGEAGEESLCFTVLLDP